MNRDDIKTEIEKIFKTVLKANNFSIKDEFTADDIDGWDSLTHITIINEVEKKFSVRFKLKDLNSLNNIGNLIDLTTSKVDQK
jgi:acyl carrier protein